QYLAMCMEFNFLIVNAKGRVEEQQSVLRQLISKNINLEAFKKD
ncbi:MAG TPA: thymidylate kinase, partial [Verrucomicrobiales bacterium]|nr:thymidylate kinase [Verrucomicrobiales bacterium]